MGCGTSLDNSIMNPDKVDLTHFEVGSCIGKGGFGKVHAIIHKGTNVQMAMKRLTKSKIIGKQWQINSVWIERNLLELLNSPYINRLYFSFSTEYELFLVMPYMRGGDLQWYLSTFGAMKNKAVKYYTSELLLGLAELRRLNVVYRDFKPENCLFGDEGHIMITDFGICGQLSNSNNFKLNDRFGTVCYMSPEQYKGLSYDYCADYFSFGLTIYEMSTGKRLLTSQRNIKNEDSKFYNDKLNLVNNYLLKDLISKLLILDRTLRLGVKDITQIFKHAYFSGINWEKFKNLEQNELPPYKPNLNQVNASLENMALDAFGGDDDDPELMQKISHDQQKIFDDFDYNTNPKQEWYQNWENCTQNKTKKEINNFINELWDKPIDLKSFKQPKSELDINFDFTKIEIKRSMSVQLIGINKIS